jgi:hypothetical protein
MVAITTGVFAQENWVSLFNGQNLDGWERHSGEAKFFVADGCIVGESVETKANTFLCPTGEYADFELELDYLVDEGLNSGVQFRSELFAEPRKIHVEGRTPTVPADRVHGYQCEIDMAASRMWTAGIYDEVRRNWLYPGKLGGNATNFTQQGRSISKPGEWNRLRIQCVGTAIKTWLNGELRTDMNDAMTLRGRIGLQVHGVSKERVGRHVKFRNIRLREIAVAPNTLTPDERRAGWVLLWDGQDQKGWRSATSEKFPVAGWRIQDKALTVTANNGEESAGGGDIVTWARYSDFELLLEFQLSAGANSGIKIFAQPDLSPIDKVTGQPTKTGSAIGLEFQILDDARHPDAQLGRDGNRTLGSVYDLLPAPADKIVMPMGQWNRARIVAQGQRVQFWLNGQQTAEFDCSAESFKQLVAASKYKNIVGFGAWSDGHILLQEHGTPVAFRNIKLRKLP